MKLSKPLREYASVQTWVNGLREQWGEVPNDMDARIEVLRQFCGFVGREPDAMIEECSRDVEGGKRIRVKGRRFYSEKIAEFQAEAPGTARDQLRTGNTVRSFMIHNGIFMQAGLTG